MRTERVSESSIAQQVWLIRWFLAMSERERDGRQTHNNNNSNSNNNSSNSDMGTKTETTIHHPRPGQAMRWTKQNAHTKIYQIQGEHTKKTVEAKQDFHFSPSHLLLLHLLGLAVVLFILSFLFLLLLLLLLMENKWNRLWLKMSTLFHVKPREKQALLVPRSLALSLKTLNTTTLAGWLTGKEQCFSTKMIAPSEANFFFFFFELIEEPRICA